MTTGDTVAIFDPDTRRWRSAEVISLSPLRATVATLSWWAIVPRNPDAIRPIRLLAAPAVQAA